MPVPDYETMMLPVLQSFADGAKNVSEVIPLIITKLGITPQEAEELIPSGRITYVGNRAHWARTYMSKAGLLRSPKRNHHEITDLGRKILASHPNGINNKILLEIPDFAT